MSFLTDVSNAFSGFWGGGSDDQNNNSNNKKLSASAVSGPKAQRHNIQGREIQEETLISEGGYGYIWRAYDTQTREVFALKKMICQVSLMSIFQKKRRYSFLFLKIKGRERAEIARSEMKIMRALPDHPNIVKFVAGSLIEIEDGGLIGLYLMELCEGGSLFDLMQKHMENRFREAHLVHIMREVCQGLLALHTLNPPLTHRDIKIENILINNRRFKLCDFGSCSSERLDFSQIPRNQHHKYEETFERFTTLMYRPPEMCDLFQGYQVNEKVDVWMLGCVLYTLCFFQHPFIEGQKLAIVTATYRFPEKSSYPEKIHDLIRHMLTPNPRFRPSVQDLIVILEGWDTLKQVPLNVKRNFFQERLNQLLLQKQEALEIKNRNIVRKQEEESFDKKVRPIKQFEGDIPLSELMKIQQQIHKEQDNASFSKSKKQKQYIASVQNQQQKQQQQQQQFQVQKKPVSNDEWKPFTEAGASAGAGFNQQQQPTQNSDWGQFQFNWSSQNTAPAPQKVEQKQQGAPQSGFDDWFEFQSAQKSAVTKPQADNAFSTFFQQETPAQTLSAAPANPPPAPKQQQTQQITDLIDIQESKSVQPKGQQNLLDLNDLKF